MYVDQNFVNSLFDFCLKLESSSNKSLFVKDFYFFLSRHFRIDLAGLYLHNEKDIVFYPYETQNNDLELEKINNLFEEDDIIFRPVNNGFNFLKRIEKEKDLKYVMMIPLRERKDFLGILIFYFKDYFKLNLFLRKTFKVLGRFMTLIVGKNILYEKMEQRLAELLTMQNVSDFVNSTLDFEKLVDITLDAIVGLFGLRSCSITVFLDKLFSDIYTRQQKALIASVDMSRELKINLNKGVYRKLSKTGEIVTGTFSPEKNNNHSMNLENLIPTKLKSELEYKYVILPVILGDELYGSINIFDPTINHIQNIQQSFMESFANQFSVALQNSKLYRQQSELANKDGLTNLYNHAYFQNRLSLILENEQQMPISLILMDIDDFKKVNDQYGHLTGDRVLKKLSTTLKQYCRDGDLAVRYGGEEFVVLLPSTAQKEAFIIAQRLRKRIADNVIKLENGKKLSVTVSIGVAEYNSEWEKKDFIDKVDQLLYIAKDNGKNRVETGD